MLRLSKKLLFAIEAVVDIAYNSGGQPVQSRDIAARQGIPRRYLEQVLQQLVRTGILASVRGPQGGYRLARERRRIALGDISRVVSALEQAEEPVGYPAASKLGQSVVGPLWQELQDDILARLDAVTVEDLCLRARRAGIASEGAERLDYII